MGNSRQTLYSVVITGFWNILSRRNLHIVAKERIFYPDRNIAFILTTIEVSPPL